MTTDPASPLGVLERWEAHGATWRIRSLTEALAVIDLCTCDGTPVDELRSHDAELLRHLHEHSRPKPRRTRPA